MNFNKKCHVFNGVPGFDSSKGERIAKALQRLWAKIQHLEQIRLSEKSGSTNGAENGLPGKDLTLTDIQFKLLVLQLQYVRSLLKKKSSNATDSNADKTIPTAESNCQDHLNTRISTNDEHIESKETQTGESLIGNLADTDASVFAERNEPFSDLEQYYREIKNSTASENYRFLSSKPSSQPHYHLKLDDVPFILGASTSASHSFVANVQNVIAMMKSHNKSLCGPKAHIHRSGTSGACKGEIENDKMMEEMKRDLTKLSQKQKDLVKRFEKNGIQCNTNSTSDADKVQRRARFVSESSPHFPVTGRHASESTVKDCFRKSQVNHKPIVPKVRMHSSSMTNVERRKMLRSLQDFKTHLSEQDITWD